VVLLSGGTSKGAGDLSYRVASELRDPGIVVHGVALKPGKPVCLAASGGKPVVVLPGFPTSAIFTFHEFVAPVIRRLAGAPPESRSTVPARLAVKVNSDPGRTEYLLVGLVEETRGESQRKRGQAHFASRTSQNEPVPFQEEPVLDHENPRLVAYPMGKGSGSVTTFSQADGFITIGRHEEIVEAGAIVAVQLLGRDLRPADLVVIGSHCVGLDYLLGRMQESGYSTRFLAVGSTAGLEAVRRGQCDVAGIHLLNAASGIYNRPFLGADMELLPGYGRQQGIVYRRGDARFEGKTAAEAVDAAKRDPACIMVNRNQGSGTRILIDGLLGEARPGGYAVQSRSHNAVAAAVAQGRADWGVAIENVARRAGLGFLPLAREEYDFAVARDRLTRPAVQAFARLLADERVRSALADMGFAPPR
jgi:putative molybdopterin biosynthesis protein